MPARPKVEPAPLDLDTQLIDPWSEDEECRIDTPGGCVPGLKSFKQLIREDYYMAESLWAGLFCSLGVGLGMQMVRAVIVNSAAPPPPDLMPTTGYFLNAAAEAAATSAAEAAAAAAAEAVEVAAAGLSIVA